MQIEKIHTSKHKKGRILLYLEDGTLLKITEQELLSFDLAAGRELDAETLAVLKNAAAASTAKSQAAAIIGRRAMSKHNLIRKLTDKGETLQDAKDAADWLEEIGAVNDADYAALLVRHCASMGYGPARYTEKLYQAGIAKDLWGDAMADAPDSADLLEQYLANRLHGKILNEKELKRTANTLARRGFGWAEIRTALRSWAESDDFID